MRIGFKMKQQYGFRVFINDEGGITISQDDKSFPEEDHYIILSKPEASLLATVLCELAEEAKDNLVNIYSDCVETEEIENESTPE